MAQSSRGQPRGIQGDWDFGRRFPAKELCSNCGLCRTSQIVHVREACAFIGDGMSRGEKLEPAVHGRGRNFSGDDLDEAYFGVHETIALVRGARDRANATDAQWSGVATGIAMAWLEAGKVDAVVVAGSKADGKGGFAEPEPLLCRTPEEVLRGRRVKPSLCPSLAILDEVRDDPQIQRLLFCGVGCAVQALRSIGPRKDGKPDPAAALGLEQDGLYVLGTHCVDNSPTPERALRFVEALPGVGKERAGDVRAYEFMADFRVHARLREKTDEGNQEGFSYVKPAYMTLPPSIGIPSIADSCYACFDYTNGLADLVVGYMGAPFDRSFGDEMHTAPLMVTVRNSRGRAMLETAIELGRVELLQDGGHGGRSLPSEGDRAQLTMKTVEADSLVRSLTEPDFVPADKGAPEWLGNAIAFAITAFGGLPKGLEFARFSIDYHFLRNQVFVEDRLGAEGAARHVPSFASALQRCYAGSMEALREKWKNMKLVNNPSPSTANTEDEKSPQ